MALIEKIPGVYFTDTTIPKLPLDAMINAGTKFLFDFKHKLCNPAQADLANGATLYNLVDGAANATVVASSGLAYSRSGLFIPGSGGARISLGTGYDMNAGSKTFVVIGWMQLTTGYSSTSYGSLFTKGATTDPAVGSQWYFDNGNSGGRLRGGFTMSGSGAILEYASLPALDTPHQFAVAYEGGLCKFFLDGVQLSQVAFAGPVSALAAATDVRIGGSTWKGWIHRVLLEDLTVSGKTASAQVASDYAANTGRFV